MWFCTYVRTTVLNAAYFSGAYVANIGLIFTPILEDTNPLLVRAGCST